MWEGERGKDEIEWERENERDSPSAMASKLGYENNNEFYYFVDQKNEEKIF